MVDSATKLGYGIGRNTRLVWFIVLYFFDFIDDVVSENNDKSCIDA